MTNILETITQNNYMLSQDLLGTIFQGSFTLTQFLIALGASIVLGFILSLVFMYKNTYSKSVVLALVLIPAIESVVIMLVNDNLGLGLSVAGSFALIRFRSIKGNAKELVAIFIAMTIGIVTGTGFIALAVIFTTILSAIMFVLTAIGFGQPKENKCYLKITIPESLNYNDVFEDILNKYTSSHELTNIKTLTLGSLFRVEYSIFLKDSKQVKQMIDELRTRNGNLEIACGKEFTNREEL